MALIITMSLVMGTQEAKTSFFDFTLTNIRGHEVSMSEYKGKVVMVVNTASKCGFTRQYRDLQKLHDTYKDQGLVILGFPANNFGKQEPGSNEEIVEFCELNYNISFPLFSKIDVVGPNQHSFFEFLTGADNQNFTGAIKWNFEKFLIDKDGNLQHRFRSFTNPKSKKIVRAIEQLLR